MLVASYQRVVECDWTACGWQGVDFFGGPVLNSEVLLRSLHWQIENEQARVVVISDVWLDRPQTLDQLRIVLSGGPLKKCDNTWHQHYLQRQCIITELADVCICSVDAMS
jgi:hypothetical protein